MLYIFYKRGGDDAEHVIIPVISILEIQKFVIY